MERDPNGRTSSATRHRGGSPQRGRARVRRNRLLALAILAILALAALAPTGQASDSQARAERQAQRALLNAERQAEREARRRQREASRQATHEAKALHHAEQVAKAERRAAIRAANKEDEHAVVAIGCTSITVHFRKFDATPSNKQYVFQKILFKQLPAPLLTYIEAPEPFVMEGSEATETIPIVAPLGASTVGIRAHFETGGEKRSISINQVLGCDALSQFTLKTTQSLSGPFGAGTLAGKVGETVDYQTVATNTGNTPLRFGSLSDPGCQGAITGGSKEAIAPRGTTSWYCHHTLTAADLAAGSFANAASVTATTERDPLVSSLLGTSSGVLVSPVEAGEKEEVTVPAAPSSSGSGNKGAGDPPATKNSVLSFTSATVPSLLGPARCVRGRFTVSVKAAGVTSVTFYIDGKRLGRRTSHSASRGLISMLVSGAGLKAGVHHLLAKITMVPGSKVLAASRTRLVRRCQAATATHSH